MQVILLERVESLGQMGDVVTVKAGYARNFLLPRQKALRATSENVRYFDGQKKVLEAENIQRRDEAEKVAKKADGLKVAVIRQASEAGQLYGSVTARDIADAISDKGVKVSKEQVRMDRAYKMLGLFPIKVALHPEVVIEVTLNIARSVEEAKLQEERGEALIVKNAAEERAAEMAEAQARADAKAAKAAEAEGEAAAAAANADEEAA